MTIRKREKPSGCSAAAQYCVRLPTVPSPEIVRPFNGKSKRSPGDGHFHSSLSVSTTFAQMIYEINLLRSFAPLPSQIPYGDRWRRVFNLPKFQGGLLHKIKSCGIVCSGSFHDLRARRDSVRVLSPWRERVSYRSGFDNRYAAAHPRFWGR